MEDGPPSAARRRAARLRRGAGVESFQRPQTSPARTHRLARERAFRAVWIIDGGPRVNVPGDQEITVVEKGNAVVGQGNTGVVLRNTIVELGNAVVELGNTDVKLGNTEVKLGNTGVKLRNTGVKLRNTNVRLGNTGVDLGNTGVRLGNTGGGKRIVEGPKIIKNAKNRRV